MAFAFAESHTENRRGVMIFVVEDDHGNEYEYKSAAAANRSFPGAFDDADTDTDEE